MRVLLLVMAEQRVILDGLYQAIQNFCDFCEIVKLSSSEQSSLHKVFKKYNPLDYDRVVIFSRLKKLSGQECFLRYIPGLVFIEHDACQNYMPSSKYFGRYIDFYKKLPSVKLLVSSYSVAEEFCKEGLDAVFVPKGYDESLLRNTHSHRDIEMAFVGSTKSKVYLERANFLGMLKKRVDLEVVRTESGFEYLEMLNRIKVFVSADIGMNEYMIKNFEAMACGCVLLAYKQGKEEDALGFRDGENIVLYTDVSDAELKLNILLENPRLAADISKAGQKFVEENYTFTKIGERLAKAICGEVRSVPKMSALRKAFTLFRYGIKF